MSKPNIDPAFLDQCDENIEAITGSLKQVKAFQQSSFEYMQAQLVSAKAEIQEAGSRLASQMLHAKSYTDNTVEKVGQELAGSSGT